MTTIGKYDTLIAAITDLRKAGYENNFERQGDGLKCIKTKEIYRPQEMRIKEYHRFEGMSNPGDSSVIFAIECKDGQKGVVISSFGTYADMDLLRIMDKIKIKSRDRAHPAGVRYQN